MESQKRFKIFGENGNHILYGDNEQNWLQTRSFKGIKKTQTIPGALKSLSEIHLSVIKYCVACGGEIKKYGCN